MNWIIPFVIGVLVGQEIQDIPRVRPFITAGIKRLIDFSKEIAKEASQNSPPVKQNARKSIWRTERGTNA
jgi:hypothetical protein